MRLVNSHKSSLRVFESELVRYQTRRPRALSPKGAKGNVPSMIDGGIIPPFKEPDNPEDVQKTLIEFEK